MSSKLATVANAVQQAHAMGLLGAVATDPVVHLMRRYWWVPLVGGIGVWAKVQQAKEKEKKVGVHHYVTAATEMIFPMSAMFAVIEVATRFHTRQQQQAQTVPFTVREEAT